MSNGIFSPPITPGSTAPATPASDLGVGEYFPNVLGSSMEDGAVQKLSELDLSDTGSLKSLDTVDPADQTLEELAPSESPPPSPTPSGTSHNPIPADISRQFTCLACDKLE